MSLALENKTSTAQLLITALNTAAGKNSIIDFDQIGSALQHIEKTGIPNNKHEEYKYCNVDAILRKEFKNITNKFEAVSSFPEFKNAINVYVINGTFHSVIGSENKLIICSLEEATTKYAEKTKLHLGKNILPASDAFAALNTAYTQAGVFIWVEKNTAVEKPIYIHHITNAKEASFINPRNLFVFEKGSKTMIIEHFTSISTANCFSTNSTEIVIEENAFIKHIRVQSENEHAYSVNTTETIQSTNSNYDALTFVLSGSLVRNNHLVRLIGQNIESHLNGLIVGRANNLIDNHTYIDHAMPNCNSNELYKGIAYDKSTLVFNGKIMVRRDAQKTNAYQSSKNILMSDDATVNTKPQLEIFADDVKCSHGTSTGKVDEEALFYLKARGIGDASARKLLLQAFAQELIEKIEIPELEETILELFEASIN